MKSARGGLGQEDEGMFEGSGHIGDKDLLPDKRVLKKPLPAKSAAEERQEKPGFKFTGLSGASEETAPPKPKKGKRFAVVDIDGTFTWSYQMVVPSEEGEQVIKCVAFNPYILGMLSAERFDGFYVCSARKFITCQQAIQQYTADEGDYELAAIHAVVKGIEAIYGDDLPFLGASTPDDIIFEKMMTEEGSEVEIGEAYAFIIPPLEKKILAAYGAILAGRSDASVEVLGDITPGGTMAVKADRLCKHLADESAFPGLGLLMDEVGIEAGPWHERCGDFVVKYLETYEALYQTKVLSDTNKNAQLKRILAAHPDCTEIRFFDDVREICDEALEAFRGRLTVYHCTHEGLTKLGHDAGEVSQPQRYGEFSSSSFNLKEELLLIEEDEVRARVFEPAGKAPLPSWFSSSGSVDSGLFCGERMDRMDESADDDDELTSSTAVNSLASRSGLFSSSVVSAVTGQADNQYLTRPLQ